MKNLFLLCLLFFSTVSLAQNLVLNPSFESVDSCPVAAGQFNRIQLWSNPGVGSPDLFNTCAPNLIGGSVDVPSNFAGYQAPLTGNGYAGIITYEGTGCASTIFTDYKEFIQCQLSDTLVAGQEYTVSFWASLADNAELGSSHIGVYLSPSEIGPSFPTSGILTFTPQLVNTTTILNDTIEWQQLQWRYLASGGETFLVIGNFNKAASTTTFINNCNANFPYVYYYIDDVSVSDKILSTEKIATLNKFSLYPNPSRGNTYLELEKEKDGSAFLQVLNVFGQTIMTKNLSHLTSRTLELQTNDLPNGTYFVQVSFDNTVSSKLLVINK